MWLSGSVVGQWMCNQKVVWLGVVVVSALGMRTRRPQFESLVAPLFHSVATVGKLFTHIASPVSQLLQETKLGYKREFFAPKWLWSLSALD